MDLFTREDFKNLASVSSGPCVSVYLRMFEKGKDTRQNPIRFKNALSETRKALEKGKSEAQGVQETPGVEGVLDRLDELGKLLDDGAFWRHQSQGLAFFVSPENSRLYRLPLEFADLHLVAGRFHLKPLLPLISENLRFYLLALAQKNARLYACDRLHIEPLEVEGMPADIEEALQYETEQRQLQFYTGGPVQRGTSRRQALFHGQGPSANEENDRLMRYCRIIDGALFDRLRNASAPLILAGVEYMLAIYRQVSDYPNLKEEGVVGSPDQMSIGDLHHSAWRIAAAELALLKQKALEKYNSLKGTGLAAAEITDITRAAFEGRVDRLVLTEGRHAWGRCSEEGRRVELFEARAKASDAVDLLDVAAGETILKGGEVFTLPQQKMPDGISAAAIFRF